MAGQRAAFPPLRYKISLKSQAILALPRGDELSTGTVPVQAIYLNCIQPAHDATHKSEQGTGGEGGHWDSGIPVCV